MLLPRSAVLSAVKAVKPVIVTDSPIPAFEHVWFTGTEVRGGSDSIGITVPLKTDFACGLRGNEFIALLESSTVKDVEITVEGKTLKLKLGRSNLKLPILEMDDAIWEFPEEILVPENIADKLPLKADILLVIERLLVSSGGAGKAPEQQGITFVMRNDAIELTSTDAKTVTFIIMENPGLPEGRHLVPREFFDHALRLCKDGNMVLTDELAVSVSSSGVRVFTKLIHEPFPVDYNKILDDRVPADTQGVAIPDRLESALKRAGILLAGVDKGGLKMTISKNVLSLAVDSAIGEMRDTMKLAEDHPDVEVMFNPTLLARALPYADTMIINKDSAALLADGYWYLAASLLG